jgi:RNA ligase
MMDSTVIVEGPYPAFPKIPRLSNEKCVITEKIDGTNALIYINEDGGFWTGSRTRWIVPGDDNFGFSKWANENIIELMKLGPGHHYGEWYGNGIQRGYGLDTKKFMLFNTARWGAHNPNTPNCVEVATEVYSGPFEADLLSTLSLDLIENGSKHVPGYMKPEGLVVYLRSTDQLYKHIIDK